MAKSKKSKNLSVLNKKINVSLLQVVVFALIFAAVGVYAILQSSAAPAKSTNSIWIVPLNGADANNLKYGDSYLPGFTLAKGVLGGSGLMARSECVANETTVLGTKPSLPYYQNSNRIWGGSLTLDPKTGKPLAVGSYEKLHDPIQNYWLGGGADCTLSLVKYSGEIVAGTPTNTTTLATINFKVLP